MRGRDLLARQVLYRKSRIWKQDGGQVLLSDEGKGFTGQASVIQKVTNHNVNKMVAKSNLVFQEFLLSDEGKGFTGQASIIQKAKYYN